MARRLNDVPHGPRDRASSRGHSFAQLHAPLINIATLLPTPKPTTPTIDPTDNTVVILYTHDRLRRTMAVSSTRTNVKQYSNTKQKIRWMEDLQRGPGVERRGQWWSPKVEKTFPTGVYIRIDFSCSLINRPIHNFSFHSNCIVFSHDLNRHTRWHSSRGDRNFQRWVEPQTRKFEHWLIISTAYS